MDVLVINFCALLRISGVRISFPFKRVDGSKYNLSSKTLLCLNILLRHLKLSEWYQSGEEIQETTGAIPDIVRFLLYQGRRFHSAGWLSPMIIEDWVFSIF